MHYEVVKTITSLILHDNLLQINASNDQIKENVTDYNIDVLIKLSKSYKLFYKL